MALGLTYPYCLKDGRLVSPEEVDTGDKGLTCLNGNHPILVRKGNIKVHHFAHYPNFIGTCSGETALHKAAKIVIKEGFESARESGNPFPVEWHCKDCETLRSYDAMELVDQVSLEASISSQVRVDLLFSSETGKSQFAVEVVVTHAPEPQTKSAMAELGLKVFIVEPTWELIAKLTTGIQASGTLNVSSKNCTNCQDIEKKDKQRQEKNEKTYKERQQKIEQIEKEFVHWWDQLKPTQSRLQPIFWENDKHGRKMFSSTRDKVYRNAKKLFDLKFRQQNSNKPWIFVIQHPHGKIYADLGGTEEVAIYEDSRPLLYMFPIKDPSYVLPAFDKNIILETMYEFLRGKGMEPRFSFYHHEDLYEDLYEAYEDEEDDDEKTHDEIERSIPDLLAEWEKQPKKRGVDLDAIASEDGIHQDWVDLIKKRNSKEE